MIDERLGAVIAMAIGVIGTTTIHLSKGMMRLGIARMQRREADRTARRRASVAYAVGVAMNFTNPLWVILANRFAPTVFYTSMYGVGLVALVIFARLVLGEEIHLKQFAGIAVVLVGTLLVGAGNLIGTRVSLFTADRTLLITIAVVWTVASPVGAVALKRRSLPVQEVFVGFFAGGLAALEAVVKGVSQAGEVQNTLLPTGPGGWWLFGASFLGAAGAFGMIQWSYLRSCRASVMGAVYNVAYVALPLVLTAALVDGSRLGPWSIGGLSVLTAGIVVLGTGGTSPRGELKT